MSRLIDADKLTSAVEGHEVASVLPLNDYEYGYNSGIERAVIEIEDAETVEAIPVDWIKRYINACEAVSETVGGVATKLSAEAVNVMLDYWREEQKGN